MVFCWINVFKNTLSFISTPENIYLDKSILILGGLEAEILTHIVCGLCNFLNGHHWNQYFFLVA